VSANASSFVGNSAATNPHAQVATATPTVQQVARASQEQVQRSAANPKARGDDGVVTQIPKRAERVFDAKKVNDEDDKREDEAIRSTTFRRKGSLDLEV
jgi:hypothetical protein